MIGTRFEATHEAMLSAAQAKAIVAARGDDTSRNRVFDIARRSPWPTKYTARMLRNPFFDRWQDREDVLRADTAAQDVYLDAVRRDDPAAIPVWAGEGVDLITAIEPAADVLTRIADEAGTTLAGATAHRRRLSRRRDVTSSRTPFVAKHGMSQVESGCGRSERVRTAVGATARRSAELTSAIE
ncbi:hypothetical protein [Nocardia brasiliensis]|uniref:hypothetical protein n=1 Tax=Nocardia brasiliensis TaxID=37326 RepID=UPI00068C9539|nr:hypothetical protein [Nocardia brasiliensis]